MTSLTELINTTIAIHNELPLLVNDKKYPLVEGYETEGGYYKNGYKCSKIDGLGKKYKYYKLFIYTSAKHRVWIEEKFLIRIEKNGGYTIKSHRGWDNIDLMIFGESEDHLKQHLKYFVSRY